MSNAAVSSLRLLQPFPFTLALLNIPRVENQFNLHERSPPTLGCLPRSSFRFSHPRHPRLQLSRSMRFPADQNRITEEGTSLEKRAALSTEQILPFNFSPPPILPNKLILYTTELIASRINVKWKVYASLGFQNHFKYTRNVTKQIKVIDLIC